MVRNLFFESIYETPRKQNKTRVKKTVNGKELNADIQQVWLPIPPKNPVTVDGRPFNKTSNLFLNLEGIPEDEMYELMYYVERGVMGRKLSVTQKQTDKENNLWHIAYRINDFNPKNSRLTGTRVVENVMNFFKAKGYTVPSYEKLMRNVVTPEEYANVKKKSEEKWQELLSDLGKPETMELIKKYIAAFGKIYEYVYGWKLSFNNAKLILSQKPDASLVMTENNWKAYFNCTVKPGAQRILYIGVWSDRHTKTVDDAQKYADTHGIQFDKGDERYLGHALYGLTVNAANKQHNTCLVYGYDSSDVEPIDPNNDWRVTRFGMTNNLTGEPNTISSDYYNELSLKAGKDNEDYRKIKAIVEDNARFGLNTVMALLQAYDPNSFKKLKQEIVAMEKASKENGTPVNVVPYISRAMYIIVDKQLEEVYKIRRDYNRNAGRQLITSFIMYAIGVWDASSLTTLGGTEFKKSEIIHYSNIINKLLNNIESIRDNTLDKLKSALAAASQGEQHPAEPQQGAQQYGTVAESLVRLTENENMRLTHVTPNDVVNMADIEVVPDNTQEQPRQDEPETEPINPETESQIKEINESFFGLLKRMNKTIF